MSFKNVNSNVKKNWMINRSIVLTILLVGYLCSIVFIPKEIFGLWLGLVILESILLFMQIVYAYIFPSIQYKKYLYLVKDDEIVISKGVIFIESTVIPVVQIQDIGFSQGPIELMLGLASLEISTAGSDHTINGLTKEKAEELVNQLKEKIKVYVNKKGE